MADLTWDATDLDGAATQSGVEHASERGSSGLRLGRPNTHLSPDAVYRFHTGSGSTLADVSGNSNDLTISGASWTSAPSRFAGALSFDGVDDYAEDAGFVHADTDIMAFEAWVRPAVASGRMDFFDAKRAFKLTWDDLTSQGFAVRIYGDNTGAIGPTGLAPGEWHHVNAYWDVGTEVGLSVNGASFATYATSDGLDNTDGPTVLGADDGASGKVRHFEGDIAEVRLVSGGTIPVADSLYVTSGSLITAGKTG